MLLWSLIEILSLAAIICTWTQLNNIDIKSMTAWANSPEFKYKAFQLCLMWAGFIFLYSFALVYCYCFSTAMALCDNFLFSQKIAVNFSLFEYGEKLIDWLTFLKEFRLYKILYLFIHRWQRSCCASKCDRINITNIPIIKYQGKASWHVHWTVSQLFGGMFQ